MNMRQHKRWIMARQLSPWALVFEGRRLQRREQQEFLLGDIPQGVTLIQPEVEAAKVEFVCVKVKDGSVVDTFDTREAALELVLKHAKQRKAKLQVMNSLTQELVVFAEEEMA